MEVMDEPQGKTFHLEVRFLSILNIKKIKGFKKIHNRVYRLLPSLPG